MRLDSASAWLPKDERIAIRRSPNTGSWRVTEGGRLAYYAASYEQAMKRADELIAKRHAKRNPPNTSRKETV